MSELLDEAVDDGVVARVLRSRPPTPGNPPLAVVRTVHPDGPTRPPVILVHGLAQNRYTWRIPGRSLTAWLARRGYEVLNLELRGHGRSREPGVRTAVRFSDYVDDLVRIVRGCGSVPFVIGHSLGGAVGIAAAEHAPLRGLVHLAGVYRFATHNRTLRWLARLTVAGEPTLRSLPVKVRTQLVGRAIARLYRITDVAGYGAPIAGWAPGSIERDRLADRLRLGFDWTSADVWVQMSRWALGEEPPFAASFRALDLPLLVLAGDADPLVTHADARITFEASGSTDKELLLLDAFEHGGHWGHIDLILGRRAPAVVWPHIGAWLDARCPEAS